MMASFVTLLFGNSALAYEEINGVVYAYERKADAYYVTNYYGPRDSDGNSIPSDVVIESVVAGKPVIGIWDEAFYFYSNADSSYINSITIPDSVTYIGNRAFYFNTLTTIYGGNSIETIGESAFARTRLTTVELPDSVRTIGDGAFQSCTSLTTVVLNEGLESIGRDAFGSCTRLTSVTFPSTLTNIDTAAFKRCSKLTSIELGSEGTDLVIGNEAFSECTLLADVKLNNGVVSIGDKAFYNTIVQEAGIPATLRSLGAYPFYSKNTRKKFTGYIIDPNNPYFKSVDGCIYSKDGTTLINVPLDYQGTLTVPEGVTTIGVNAANGCGSITKIVLPSTIRVLEDFAFDGCAKVASINLPVGLTNIGKRSLTGMKSLTKLEIPQSVTYIDEFGCASMSSTCAITLYTDTEYAQTAFSDSPAPTRITPPVCQHEWRGGDCDPMCDLC